MITSHAKKIINLFIFLVFVSGSIYYIHYLKKSEYFPIRKVNVYGIQAMDRDDVQQIVTPLVNSGFFAVKVESVREKLLKMPWASQVTVRRVWPDQVDVTVSEKKPLARWNETSLLSESGELFKPALSSFPENLPEFVGPEGEQISMTKYYLLANQILAPLHFQITHFELVPQATWNMILSNGIKLVLSYKDILTQLEGFVKVYPKIIGDRGSQVEYIDLRYSNGFAVRWKV